MLLPTKATVTLQQICQRFPQHQQREILPAGHTALGWSGVAPRRKAVSIVILVLGLESERAANLLFSLCQNSRSRNFFPAGRGTAFSLDDV